MLVLAQVRQLVIGREPDVAGPLLRMTELAAAQPEPGSQSGNRPHVGRVVAVVDPVSVVEQLQRGVEVAFGLPEPSRDHP